VRKVAAWKLGTTLVGAVVLAFCLRYVLTSFRWSEVLRIVKEVKLAWLVGAGSASIIAFWFVRAARWFVILRNLGIRVGFRELYICSAASLGIATVTPLQTGEMLKVELLRRRGGLARSAGYGSFAVERVIDLFTIVSAAAVCILSGIGFGISRRTALFVWGLSVLLFLTGVFVLRKTRTGGKVGEFIRDAKRCLAGRATFPVVMALTLAAWALVVLGWQLSLHSIGIDIGFLKALTLMTVVTLAGILSLVPGGLGVSEVGTSRILMGFGQTEATAQAGAVIIRCYAILMVLLGLVHLALQAALKARSPASSVPESDNG
jgi:uncharacterized membrane protein YbhN (UPF0104 family)